MKKRYQFIVYFSLLSIFTFSMFFLFHNRDKTFNEKKLEDYGRVVTFEPAVTKANILAVGDVLIHGAIYTEAYIGKEQYDFNYIFESVKPIIEKADFAIANQETILGGVKLGLSTYPRFNSPHEVGDALQNAGFDVLTMANNHSLDQGEAGILSATSYMEELNMPYVGINRDEDDRNRISIFDVNDIKIALLAYTYGTNGIPFPKGKDYLVNTIDYEVIKDEIARAKKMSDLVIASVHLGTEYSQLPNQSQKDLYQLMVNEGVRIIFGHHPHVLQPVNYLYNESMEPAIVYYSLGNFISAQTGIEKLIGGIATIEITKSIDASGLVSVDLGSPHLIPIYTSKKPRFHIYPLKDLDLTILKDRQTQYEKTINLIRYYQPGIDVEISN